MLLPWSRCLHLLEPFLPLRRDLQKRALGFAVNCRMIPAVIEPTDPCRAPPSHMLGEVHCDLTIEDSWLRVSLDTRLTESRRDHVINRRQGNALAQLGS